MGYLKSQPLLHVQVNRDLDNNDINSILLPMKKGDLSLKASIPSAFTVQPKMNQAPRES